MAAQTHQVARNTIGNQNSNIAAQVANRRNGETPLATLEERTSPAAVREAKQDGLKTGTATNFSGQYLYDALIGNDQAERTKLDIVRAAVKAVDTGSFKKALKDMVEIAKNTAVPAKLKTAQNHQSVMRKAFGALKHASDKLAEFGYTDQTGYQEMSTIGKAALDAKHISWEGIPLEEPAVADKRLKQKEEDSVLQELRKDNKQNLDESLRDYNDRIMGMFDAAWDDHEAAKHDKLVLAEAQRVLKAFPEYAQEVAAMILELLANPPEVEGEEHPA